MTIVEIEIYLAHGIRFGFPSIESFVFMVPVILQKEIKKFPRHTEITQKYDGQILWNGVVVEEGITEHRECLTQNWLAIWNDMVSKYKKPFYGKMKFWEILEISKIFENYRKSVIIWRGIYRVFNELGFNYN